MNVLITGAAGYIGSHTAKQLLETTNHNITIIDNFKTGFENTIKTLKNFGDFNFINQDLSDSDMIVAYYTIQFINSSKRQEIINKIYDSLNWGGAFFMFEKTRGMDARFQDMITSVYYDYKISEGYSLEEIMSKHLSLKGVLEPFSTKGNIDMLKRAGFIDINTIFKFVPFEGFLAIK